MTPQRAYPGKQVLAALGVSRYTLRSTRANITVRVGWEDIWKEQLSPRQILHYFCSFAEGTCSPAQHPGNGRLVAALSHSATSQLEHCSMVGGPISTFPPWPYLSRAAETERGVPHGPSPADLYLFTLE